jgi:hypothetical protein
VFPTFWREKFYRSRSSCSIVSHSTTWILLNNLVPHELWRIWAWLSISISHGVGLWLNWNLTRGLGDLFRVVDARCYGLLIKLVSHQFYLTMTRLDSTLHRKTKTFGSPENFACDSNSNRKNCHNESKHSIEKRSTRVFFPFVSNIDQFLRQTRKSFVSSVFSIKSNVSIRCENFFGRLESKRYFPMTQKFSFFSVVRFKFVGQ